MKKVLVIAGPTASGKTELSLSVAAELGGEIVSADSMQIYRGMDIGTAKATPEERAIRRFNELKEKGENVSYAEVLANIVARDRQDSERETAPLAAAEDAVTFVNDGIMPDECADYIIYLMNERAEKLQ